MKWLTDHVNQDKAASHRKPLARTNSACIIYLREERVKVSDARNLAGTKKQAQVEIQQRKSTQSAVTNHLFKEELL